MKHIKKFNEMGKIPSGKQSQDFMSSEFDYLADMMIKANDGDLDGKKQSMANDFFGKYQIDTTLDTYEIIDELFDKLGNQGIEEMKEILEM